MSLITFNITYKKRIDHDALKMLNDSEFNQMKLIICGKYKVYDLSSCFIYCNNELLDFPEQTKLKDIFKKKKVTLTLQTEKLSTPRPQPMPKYTCTCKAAARFICDKCDEFLCEACSKKSKHNIHIGKVIRVEEYTAYVKAFLHKSAKELDEKIAKDEAYQYYCHWSYDLSNELSAINQSYEYAKTVLEDIKQIEIDTLITLSDTRRFSSFTSEMENLLVSYSNINTQESLVKVLVDKAKLISESNEMIKKFSELKQAVLCYYNTVKDVQAFNRYMLKTIKDRFVYTKRKYMGAGISSSNTINVNHYHSHDTSLNSINSLVLNNPDNTLNSINVHNTLNDGNCNQNNTTITNVNVNLSMNTPSNRCQQMSSSFQKAKPTSYRQDTYQPNQTITHERLLLKLKDQKRVWAFLTQSQTFKEKSFIDNANFKATMTNESDITQLNHNNRLYMLTGKNYNKTFYYDYASNAVYGLGTTLGSHYYGAFVYASFSNALYLIGGNNTTKCEVHHFANLNTSLQSASQGKGGEWRAIPDLNEERQEFGSAYVNNSIYVFFGFSPVKGYNLSSIERYNVEKPNSPFDVIYINEQIKLSSIACALYKDNEIILLGGFDGKNYVDTSLIFNLKEKKIRDSHIVIPNMNKHFQFLFQKESAFVRYDESQMLFDMKGNAHVLTDSTYEVFSTD